VVKICTRCHYVNAGGFRCSECGGRLIHTSDAEARDLPSSVWKNQRVDYGARRGMILRFLAIFVGALTALFGLRESVALASPWSWIAAAVAVVTGLVVWRVLYHAAGRGVRVWVLAKGRVRKGRLLRAIVLGLWPWHKKESPRFVGEARRAK
jgi:hypothetical protein